MDWIELVKLVFQIVFWGIIATIAILTYLWARRTIFQPIRTEVFKAQLEELTNILRMFVGKEELELRDAFGFEKLFHVNACRMYDSFAATFFDVKQDIDERPYNRTECPSSLFTTDYAEKHVRVMDGHTRDVNTPKCEEGPPDPRVRAAMWNDYTHGELHVPQTFSEMEKKLSDLLDNPLLPSEVTTLIKAYQELAFSNLEMVRNILKEAAPQMVGNYPTVESLGESSYEWIRGQYLHKFRDLKPKADEIVSFVRSYYGTDNVMKV